MASTDIRQFLFYFKYLWSPADFTSLQLWLQETTAGIAEGLLGAAVLKGLGVTPGTGLQVLVDTGICVGDEGQLMVNGAQSPVNLTVPISAPKRSLIVMRPTIVNMTVIPQPDNPSNNVPLHQQLTFTFVVIDGAENVNPVYPSKQDGDCIVAGVMLTPGQSTVMQANIERTPISLARKKVHPIKTKSGNYNIVAEDEHIDYDLSGGAATAFLPPSNSVAGQDFAIVKIDTSGNTLAVSGQDLIDGQTQIILDTQWQSLQLRSVGLGGWRVL